MVDPFRTHAQAYEAWFDRFEEAYTAEVAALQLLRPKAEPSLEVGVGSGRFAKPLEITFGLDPAPEMLTHAVDRGIEGVLGVGEHLPFCSNRFELLLMVTTVCFFDDLEAAFAEAHRVLAPGGDVLLGYIDRESPVGQRYEERKSESPFYREATFVRTDELETTLRSVGFTSFETRQTVFTFPEEMDEPDPVRPGTGDGSFVALRAST